LNKKWLDCFYCLQPGSCRQRRRNELLQRPVWPGYNSAMAIVAGDETEEVVREPQRTVAKWLKGAGFIIYELAEVGGS